MTRFLRLCLVGLLLGTALVGVPAPPTAAQTFNSGSTGADGAFNPPTSVPAGTTVNGSTYTLPLPATGIYNFTTITVPSGVTATFARNAANSPVILLATGNITVAGTIEVSGSDAPNTSFLPGRGGPGGFDGGVGGDGLTTNQGGAGLGPGGGSGGAGESIGGGASGYGTQGTSVPAYCGAAGPTYGNSLLRPILGGSGGGGASGRLGTRYGGGGGGAIQLASSTQITLTGTIRANGGTGVYNQYGTGGGGSGGAIRLTAPTVTVTNGNLSAQGGNGCGSFGGMGRIRLEGTTVTFSGTINPLPTTSLPQPVFPGTGMPSLAISTIGGIAVPANPAGSALQPPDVLLPVGSANPVAVLLTASNISVGTTVQVIATPQNGGPATASCSLAGTLAASTCTANVNISLTQTNVITASATFPLLSSAADGPLDVKGEEVTHVKVAAVLGGESTVTYLTRSGREIVIPSRSLRIE